MKWLLAIFALMLGLPAHAGGKPLVPCGDFLKEIGLSRPDVTFQGCAAERLSNPMEARLEATYSVAGKNLSRVEAWAMQTFGMEKLRFACCSWDSPPVWFQAKNGLSYEITLGGETIINDRRDWENIPYFILGVGYYLEDP